MLKLHKIDPFVPRELMSMVLTCRYKSHCLGKLDTESTETHTESCLLNKKSSYLSDHIGKVTAVSGRESYQRSGERCQGRAMPHNKDDTWKTIVRKERQLGGCLTLQTSLLMWQSVLRWSEKVWCVADMPASEKKYLLSEQLSRNVIFLCWSALQGTSRMTKEYTLVIFYCLLFKFDFSFLFYKLYLFWLSTGQKLQAYLELCAI